MAQYGDNGDGCKPRAACIGLLPAEVPWYPGDAFLLLSVFILSSVLLSLVGASLLGRENPWAPVLMLGGAPPITLWATYRVLKLRAPAQGRLGRLIGLRWPQGIKPWLCGAFIVALGIALLAAASQVQQAALTRLGVDPEDLPRQPIVEMMEQNASAGAVFTLIFFAVVVAPVTEEVLFRGMLYLPLRSRMGPVAGALAACALFAAVHFYAVGLVYLFVMALILTALFEVTGSLYLPMVAHAVHNAVTIVVVLAAS